MKYEIVKRVLYYAASPSSHEACLRGLERVASVERGEPHVVRLGDMALDWSFVRSSDEAWSRLGAEYVSLLVLDLRPTAVSDGAELAEGLALLARLDHPLDIELRFGFHRILALVAGDSPETDRLIAELGARGVVEVVRERPGEADSGGFAHRVLTTIRAVLARRTPGRLALAASGGGITGIFFELGALKCLDDCMTPGVGWLDMYFGISAGAVVSGVLSVGYSVDELMAAIAGHPGGRIPALDLRLFRIGHLNFRDMFERLGSARDIFWHALYELVWHRALPSFNDLFLDYTALVGPPFRSDRFESVLRALFEHPGATNDFRELGRPLFVGASDQDARRHVLFGAEGSDHVQISRAIQGSLSVNPAFSAVEIESRYYEDGAVTRTSNFVEAIARGADLIFVLDPFVPYVSQVAGTAHRRGVLYNVDQDLRSLSYTRFENTRDWVLREYPGVSTYTFLPSNRVRRLLTLNPMDHRPFLPIWKGAYVSTFERIKRVQHRLGGDLLEHGVTLELSRAAQIVEQLENAGDPTFPDFFPGREVVLATPPLTREREAQPVSPALETAAK